jgi:DNA-binding PadR family transcriptional regulator
MRRGDIRWLLLDALVEAPGHGYDLIGRLEGRSGGRWRPSPGSVYPTLQLLEEEGLVTSAEVDGKKVYSVTEAGRTAVAERAERGADPWAADGNAATGGLRSAIGQLAAAAWQAGHSPDPAVVDAATQIVNDARKRLYELLAKA